MTAEQRKRFGRVRTASGDATWVIHENDRTRSLSAAPWLGGQPGAELSGSLSALCPVAPSKIVCIGRNYRAHAKEMGADVPAEPLLFLKPPSALLEPGGTVQLPAASKQVEHEGELGVVIGKRCRNVPAASALACVFGYTAVCDVTARDLQKKDGQWTRAKGFDGFCPAGPEIVSGLDPSDVRLTVHVNDVLFQDGRTRDMIFGVAELVAYISRIMTLEPGDLISTGTPHGVSVLAPGDAVRVSIDGIGVLEFNVGSD